MAVQPALADQSFAIPELVLDPVWALRPWPVTFRVAGHEFTIPALPAADWLAVLMTPDPDMDEVVPGLLPEDQQEEFEDLLFAGKLSLDDAQQLALNVVEAVGSRRWWVVLRLITAARAVWDYIGYEMSQVDATRLPLAAWIDAAFHHMLMNMKPDNRSMFLAHLEMVPAELVDQEAEELTMDADAFMRLAQ